MEEKAVEFFDTWFKSQEKFIGECMDSAKKLQESLLGLGGAKEGSSAAPGGDFSNLYNSWTAAVAHALNEAGDSNLNVIRETLSKTFGSSNAYMKLYDIWLPLAKAIRDRTSNGGSHKNLLDPAEYKEVMDKVFGFGSPETAAEIFGQATKVLETWGGASQGFTGPWTDAIQKSMKTLPQFMEGRPESLMNVFHNMFSAFDKTVGRIFHVPAVGKDREKTELILRSIDDLSVYMAKNTEYQHTMYVTGMAAMEKVIGAVAEKIKKGEEIKSFEEFFDLWVTVNEKTYYALFQTPDFSRLQGEVLDSSLSVRKHLFKLMELYLYDFPIALRSEMDDLYKTIYDLRKQVKGLEKRLKDVSAREVRA